MCFYLFYLFLTILGFLTIAVLFTAKVTIFEQLRAPLNCRDGNGCVRLGNTYSKDIRRNCFYFICTIK